VTLSLSSDIAEPAVLSAVLQDPTVIRRLRSDDTDLAVEDFGSPKNARIFAVMLTLSDWNQDITPVTVAAELETRGELDASGGIEYLGWLLDVVPGTDGVEFHARIIVDRAKRSAAATTLEHSARLLREGAVRPDELADRLAVPLAALADGDHRRRVQLIDDEAIERQPALSYQLDRFIPKNSFVAVRGAPGSCKTFLALGWSFCVASGIDWLGHSVLRAPTIYVAAEGRGGLASRVRAEKQHLGISGGVAGVFFHVEPVNLTDEKHVARFLRAVDRGEAPGLIVFDTLARCLAGADENSAQDMGKAVGSIDRIRNATGSAVLVLHHDNKDGKSERGSTALRGAVDVMIALKSEGSEITVSSDKAKDDEPFAPLSLRLIPVADSCVLAANSGWQGDSRSMSDLERDALVTLSRDFDTSGASFTHWLKASGAPERSFYRIKSSLISPRGYVRQIGEGRGSRFVLTDTGRIVAAASLPDPASTLSGRLPASMSAKAPLFREAQDGKAK
jgi:hypothetical protein